MLYNKPVMWDGKSDFTGGWHITRKVDGIRVLMDGENVVSRNGKPLYNMDHLKAIIMRVYYDDASHQDIPCPWVDEPKT